jgi:ATP-dependent Lon protease
VRSLEKYTKKILEKIAFQIVSSNTTNDLIIVNKENLKNYLGNPTFDD